MNTAHDLTTRLSHEAERFDRLGGSPLDLSQVLDRAGEIKRGRRMRATMMMAAVVLAVAVPTALIETKGHSDKPVTPAHHVRVNTSPLSLDGLKQGDRPHTGWFEGNVWTNPDGAQVQVSGGDDPIAVARVGDSLLVAAAGESGTRVSLIPPAGTDGVPVQSWPIDGGIAVSPKGNVAAFVRPDGVVMAVQDAGPRSFELGRIPSGSGFTAIVVQGEDCSGRSEETGCKVYARSGVQKLRTYVTEPHETVAKTVDINLVKTVDVAADGRFAGIASAGDTGSCSWLLDPDRTVRWETCENALVSFSPDDKHLLAGPAYGDGAGDSSVSILDPGTGERVLHLVTAPEVFIGATTWEDDTHLIAAVYQQGKWALVRIGLDGKREIAVSPVAGQDPYVAPFLLPAD